MGLFRLGSDSLEEIPSTTFAREDLRERADLQRWLRDEPGAFGEDLLIIAEEYGSFEDSRRRIDLLALDPDGRIVVIELKRTEDGGHMDLQAVRYAAMVSTMTFDQALDAFRRYAEERKLDVDPAARIREFLNVPDDEAPEVNAGPPRIILASGDFSKELTTSVLWLNEVGLDIRCVRLRLYKVDNDLFLDATQVLPLPEAEEYVIRVREREAERRAVRDRREATMSILVRNGVIVPGTRIALRSQHLNGTLDLDPEVMQATITDEPDARHNVRWEHDGKAYSVTGSTEKLRDDLGVDLPNSLNGYRYWSIEDDPEYTLFDLAHGTKR